MKTSLRKLIIDYLEIQSNSWIMSARLEREALDWGYSASNGSRTARRLAQKGIIERKHEGKYAYYRLRKELKPITHDDLSKVINKYIGKKKPVGIFS